MSDVGDPLLGAVLAGRYRVDSVIGRGGFATVYAAHHLRLDTPVAVKVLRFADTISASERALIVRRFDEECRVLTRLRHDHIVRTLDQGLIDAETPELVRPYLVTELCTEGSLEKLLQSSRGKGFAVSVAWPLMKAILDGLAYAHEAGVAHRDLKPQNLMLARAANGRFTPRLIDFGIAKLFDPSAMPGSGETASQTPSLCTPNYAAPEQIAGSRTGPWTDVHAVGLVFTELLSGRAAYPEDDLQAIIATAIDAQRPSPKHFGVEAGPFEAVLQKATALRPSDRYRDAGELREACVAAARELGLEAASATSSSIVPRVGSVAPLAPVSSELALAETVLNTPQAPIRASAALTPAPPAALTSPRRSRRWLFVLGAVVLVLVACAASWSLLGKPKRSIALPVRATPVVEPVSLSVVTTPWLRQRAEAAGLLVTEEPAIAEPYLALSDGESNLNGHVTLLEQTARTPPILAFVGLRTHNTQATLTVVYGISGRHALVLSMYGRDRAALRIFNQLARGVVFDVVGNSLDGPDPASDAARKFLGEPPLHR